MSVISVSDKSQFQNNLLKLKRDKSFIVNTSKDIEKKAEEGEIIVLKGSPRFILILWSINLLIIAVMLSVWIFGFNFFDLQTFIIIMSVWFGTLVLFIIKSMSDLIILHPDGFLIRRFIFFKYSQKWIFLTHPPTVAIATDSSGSKYYNIIFTSCIM